MAHAASSGGTSLAPTPTHPHHLSKNSSRDQVEMAENLKRISQVHGDTMTTIEASDENSLSARPQMDSRSGIYHSLNDSVPISEEPATPMTPTISTPPQSLSETNAPIAGQVCRYVSPYSHLHTRCCAFKHWVNVSYMQANVKKATARRLRRLCGDVLQLEKQCVMLVVST